MKTIKVRIVAIVAIAAFVVGGALLFRSRRR